MNFDVVWTKAAESELAALWANPTLRPLVTSASNLLDEQMERGAAELGESRLPGSRVSFEPPLDILFWVNESARRVLVLHVWAFET